MHRPAPDATCGAARSIVGRDVILDIDVSAAASKSTARRRSNMWGLTPAHLVILLIIILVIVGPGKLPSTGAAIGKALRGFKDAMEDNDTNQAAAPQQPAAPVPPAQYPPVQAAPAQYPPVQAAPIYPAPVAAPPTLPQQPPVPPAPTAEPPAQG
jgi:sec-independent protein translocase protein TatA